MPTEQETFDAAARGIIAQGGPSAGGRGACYYRHPKLLRKCAAGYLIPDDNYHKSFEGLASSEMVIRQAIGTHNHSLVRRLQSVHDACAIGWTNPKHDADFMTRWQRSMIGLAREHRLNAAVFDER